MTTSPAAATVPHRADGPLSDDPIPPVPSPSTQFLRDADDLLQRVGKVRELDLSAPSPIRLALACLGFATVYGAAALSLPLVAMPAVSATGLVATLGTALLTAPALLILHQFLGLNAKPVDVLAALSRGFADAGHVALGLTPFVLVLALTSRLALPAVLLCSAGLGALALALTHRRLMQLEGQHPDVQLRQRLSMFALATAWSVLVALIAARLAAGLVLPAVIS